MNAITIYVRHSKSSNDYVIFRKGNDTPSNRRDTLRSGMDAQYPSRSRPVQRDDRTESVRNSCESARGLHVMMMKRATMAEVARLANVGTMTCFSSAKSIGIC